MREFDIDFRNVKFQLYLVAGFFLSLANLLRGFCQYYLKFKVPIAVLIIDVLRQMKYLYLKYHLKPLVLFMPALLVRWREHAFDKNKIVSFYSNINYVSYLVLYEFSSTRISSLKAVRDILTFNSNIVNDLRPFFVLDVGCGNGAYSMLVFRILKNITLLYTDVGTPQVRITKLRIKNANNLGVVQM